MEKTSYNPASLNGRAITAAFFKVDREGDGGRERYDVGFPVNMFLFKSGQEHFLNIVFPGLPRKSAGELDRTLEWFSISPATAIRHHTARIGFYEINGPRIYGYESLDKSLQRALIEARILNAREYGGPISELVFEGIRQENKRQLQIFQKPN